MSAVIHDFLDSLRLAFDKDLTNGQTAAYSECLIGLPPTILPKLRKDVIAKCKRFPSVAEILELAKEHGHGIMQRGDGIVDWKPSNCAACRGSGMVGVLWKESFRDSADGEFQVRTMDRMQFGPYQDSAPFARRHPEWTLTVCRCDCGANRGAIGGLPLFKREFEKTESAWSRTPAQHRAGKTIDELRAEFRAMVADTMRKGPNWMAGIQPRTERRYQREPGDEDEL